MGSPEGTRADRPSRRRLRTGSLGAVLIVSACFAIAIGDETANFTVTNLTSHVVTVVVADRTFPAVAPGARATYQSSGSITVAVDVSYAPGQGVAGSARRSFQLSAYHPATTTGTTVYWSCTTSGMITSPASGGPVTWNVTADTLAVR
jgi:hypothetical protein